MGEKEHSILQMYLRYFVHAQPAGVGSEGFSRVTHAHDENALSSTRCFGSAVDSGVREYFGSAAVDRYRNSFAARYVERDEVKFDEYLAFGVEHIWVFDPMRRDCWQVDAQGLHLVTAAELTVPDSAIRVVLSEVFAELDQAYNRTTLDVPVWLHRNDMPCI